jgi:hypothetical protein
VFVERYGSWGRKDQKKTLFVVVQPYTIPMWPNSNDFDQRVDSSDRVAFFIFFSPIGLP